MSELVETKAQPMFQRPHELLKMVKELKKVSKKAIEVLEKGLESPDEKTRMLAAEKLLKFYMDMSKEVNQDQLNRLLLEVKVNGLRGKGSTADDEDDTTPKLDFNNINPEFADIPVVDFSEVNKVGDDKT